MLRPHRPARRGRGGGGAPGRRELPHRSPGDLGRRPRAPRGRLAGAGGGALLPGHGPRSHGPGPPAPPGRPGPTDRRRGGRALRSRRPTARRSRRRRDGRPGGTGESAGTTRLGRTGDGELELGGPGALLAALEGARTGVMRDIVATIQREQDEIIRSALPGVMVVQGGPGTGKTAVALHRAAYLLYTHRFPLERQGVLVIGPNPLFLRYIEHVLPSLGESGVTLSTIEGLVHGVPVRAEDARRRGRAEGRGPHGHRRGPGGAQPPARPPPRRRGALRRPRSCASAPRPRPASSPRPVAAPAPTTPGAASWSSSSCAGWPTTTCGRCASTG